MLIQFADCFFVELTTNVPRLAAEWRHLFGEGVPQETAVPHAQLHLDWDTHLPPLPASAPLAHLPRPRPDGRTNQLTIYQPTAAHYLLNFDDAAVVRVDLATAIVMGTVVGEEIFADGRLLDITLTSLAPLVRRQGLALVHGCAVARGEEAWLFVGGMGSGKTTAALQMVVQGWEWVADDVVLLRPTAAGLQMWPVTAHVTIRPSSAALFPHWPWPVPAAPAGFFTLPLATAVRGVCPTHLAFVHLAPESPTSQRPLPRSVALAHLAEASLDRWDAPQLPAQFTLLEQLAHQVQSYTLALGR